MWARALTVILFSALAASASGRAVSADLDQVIAADPRLTLFARAVARAGMAPTLREPGSFIVFVPSDRALANEGSAFLLDSVLLTDANAGRLADLVRHHIVRASGGAIAPGGNDELQTLAEVPLALVRVGGGLVVAGYAVVTDRIATGNGVVYIVDRLLWPRDPPRTPCAHSAGSLTRATPRESVHAASVVGISPAPLPRDEDVGNGPPPQADRSRRR